MACLRVEIGQKTKTVLFLQFGGICFIFSSFDFPFTFGKPVIQCHYHEPSAPACLSVFCEFWRSMIMTLGNREPLRLLQGRSHSDGFFWLLFLAVEKK